MNVHLFVDESRRASTYLLVAAVVPPERLGPTRWRIRDLFMPGERRIHFQAERDSRRRKILGELAANGTRARVYLGSGRPDRVRAACLDRLVREAIGLNAQRLVLESRGEADRVDRAVIHRVFASLSDRRKLPAYEHLCPHDDPALAIPDAIAWLTAPG